MLVALGQWSRHSLVVGQRLHVVIKMVEACGKEWQTSGGSDPSSIEILKGEMDLLIFEILSYDLVGRPQTRAGL